MSTIIALILAGLAVFVLWVVIRDALRMEVEIFSIRNFFLLGFIIFQLTSGTSCLLSNDFGDLWPTNLVGTAAVYTILICLFLWIFLTSYRKGWWVARKFGRRGATVESGAASQIFLAVLLLLTGVLFKLVLGQVPIIGPLAGQTSAGMLAAAAALAGWAWAPRLFNANLAAAALGILGGAVILLFMEAFGRRELLGVLLAFGWGLYYGFWRQVGPSFAIKRLAIIGSAVVLFMAVFTAARTGSERDRSIGETIAAMRHVAPTDLYYAVIGLFSGQYAAANSMWTIETYPESYDYDTLHTLVYYVTMPYPRVFWENKPNSFGREMVQQGMLTQVGANLSLGPGIIGHIVADNPWIAMPLYAILLGLVMRAIDERVAWNLDDPYIVIPAGAALAQVLGLARGELGLFLFNATTAMIGAWVFMRLFAYVMGNAGWLVRHPAPSLEDEAYAYPAEDGV
ncbi:MAG: hypothetical protein ACYTF9_14880 [Planctomycetota bacterium]|jgi:hypothetical protein